MRLHALGIGPLGRLDRGFRFVERVAVDADDLLLAAFDAFLISERRIADHGLDEPRLTAAYIPPAASILAITARISASIWSVRVST